MSRRRGGWRGLIGLAAILAAAPAHAQPAQGSDSASAAASASGTPVVFAGLVGRAFAPVRGGPQPRLVVVLHGDLADGAAYQYRFARSARDALADTAVVALMRPGYADDQGRRSPGVRGQATGDNYTPAAIDAVRRAIEAAKARYHASRVTVVGHSGGAAVAADLAEADPTLVSRLLLVSCPCDLRPWRLHMALKQLSPMWLLPVRSLSPLQGARRLPPRIRILLVVGEKDDVAPASLTAAFVSAARGAKVRADELVLPGVGHEALLDPRTLRALVQLQTAP